MTLSKTIVKINLTWFDLQQKAMVSKKVLFTLQKYMALIGYQYNRVQFLKY